MGPLRLGSGRLSSLSGLLERVMKDERQEIEILPPGEDRYREETSRIWISTNGGEIKFVKLGPFGAFMLAAGTLALLGMGFFFLTSLFFILAPIIAILGAGAYLSGLVGMGPFNRLR